MDLNRDGYADVVVGSPHYSQTAKNQGKLTAFSGRDGKVLFTLSGKQRWEKLGSALNHAGDVNRDGSPDLIVASPTRVISGSLLPLCVHLGDISITAGGSRDFSLAAGKAHERKLYLMVGSLSGTTPGLRLGSHTLPLNWDFYFDYTVAMPNLLMIRSMAFLDTEGRSQATLNLPKALLSPALVGMTVHHAYVVFRGPFMPVVDYVSNAAPLRFVQ